VVGGHYTKLYNEICEIPDGGKNILFNVLVSVHTYLDLGPNRANEPLGRKSCNSSVITTTKRL
jgi:hypothetical protein